MSETSLEDQAEVSTVCVTLSFGNCFCTWEDVSPQFMFRELPGEARVGACDGVSQPCSVGRGGRSAAAALGVGWWNPRLPNPLNLSHTSPTQPGSTTVPLQLAELLPGT